MAKIVVGYKILPTEVEVDFAKLKVQIKEALPSNAELFGDFEIEPIAFGLKALIAYIQIPEEETGVVSKVEENLENIPTVSRIQTLMVRRTR